MIHKVSGIKDFHARDGEGCQEFLSVFFCPRVPKPSYEKFSVFQKKFDIENVIGKSSIEGVL